MASIREMKELLRSHRYRVAVIGEFKRGKSSLLNALLGAEVLPTDVLPTTAVVTRILYGREKRLRILFHDGREERHDLNALARYGTKLDAQSEALAQTVREMEVTYPTAMGKEFIELIDTPGLNDNEQMSAVTLGVLGEIDAALVVLSARQPLSETEQSLIVQLIEQQDIRQILFVVSFIDALGKRELPRMLQFIEGRLQKETMARVLREHPELGDKARAILEHPVLYPVSSLQAMEAFVREDDELLEESRFDVFKRDLMIQLRAGQQLSAEQRAVMFLRQAARLVPQWQAERLRRCEDEIRAIQRRIDAFSAFLEQGTWAAQQELISVDGAMRLETAPLADEMRRCFISRLGKVRRGPRLAEAIAQALESGAEDCALRVIEPFQSECCCGMTAAEASVYRMLVGKLPREVFDLAELRAALPELRKSRHPIPAFEWRGDIVPEGDLSRMELMPQVEELIAVSLETWEERTEDALAGWRRELFRLWHEILGWTQAGLEAARKERLLAQDALEKARRQHQADADKLAAMLAEIDGMERNEA